MAGCVHGCSQSAPVGGGGNQRGWAGRGRGQGAEGAGSMDDTHNPQPKRHSTPGVSPATGTVAELPSSDSHSIWTAVPVLITCSMGGSRRVSSHCRPWL